MFRVVRIGPYAVYNEYGYASLRAQFVFHSVPLSNGVKTLVTQSIILRANI